jgi:hypothetical protein
MLECRAMHEKIVSDIKEVHNMHNSKLWVQMRNATKR